MVLAVYFGRFGRREGMRISRRFFSRVYATVSFFMCMIGP